VLWEGCHGYWWRDSKHHGYCGRPAHLMVITQTMFAPQIRVGPSQKRHQLQVFWAIGK